MYLRAFFEFKIKRDHNNFIDNKKENGYGT